jgi:alkylation response protein AidB-like acyl-CoA dehydrogenase
MDFAIPAGFSDETAKFEAFIKTDILPDLPGWCQKRELPRSLFRNMGTQGWYGLKFDSGSLSRRSALKESIISETLARVSPGVAIAALAHTDLGLMGLYLFGSKGLQQKYGAAAVEGKTVMCLGNTENIAGSDVAGIAMTAEKIEGGWKLNGTKAYVTNGLIADWGVITAVSDPGAEKKNRLSMYLVDLNAAGIRRKKLNKQVWVPSDLTRLSFNDVFVVDDHLLGTRGRGLHQVLEIFTNSRVPLPPLPWAAPSERLISRSNTCRSVKFSGKT